MVVACLFENPGLATCCSLKFGRVPAVRHSQLDGWQNALVELGLVGVAVADAVEIREANE